MPPMSPGASPEGLGMRSFLTKIGVVVLSGILAFLILAFTSAVWGALITSNIKRSPAVPWAVLVMALVLWLMWQYLAGKWWPRKTSEARRHYLRANWVSGELLGWSFLAGVLAIIALAGYWIVLFHLVPMRPDVLPDYSRYPLLTVILMLVMSALVSPISEEAGFRGYCQVMLEQRFNAPTAVVLSSLLFMLAHVNHGLFWPRLLVYFLAGVAFGAIANLTNSILASIPVHVIGDLTFFTLIWPHDSARRLIWQGGLPMEWFWIHAAQAVVFTGLTILAFRRLAKAAANAHSAAREMNKELALRKA
jgi:membrane protease YdiL (CAAX protease family)